MNSSTTLLGKIIVTPAVEKREAVELSDNSSHLTYIAFFLWVYRVEIYQSKIFKTWSAIYGQ